ncbi:hypothetical protein M9H77_35234 [Catharanthus roseus]|uniref:Uncharacterized protein n=1 Tax=Catharanthus roseus TaxID=4058 RepID=A0ACB9ZQ66_CATRO|nr:hypothetical protein M9H77_35234 [Catharanthus roseus]
MNMFGTIPRPMMEQSKSLLTEYKTRPPLRANKPNLSGIVATSQWRPPCIDTFKINVDAAAISGKATIKVVIRNHSRKVIASLARPTQHMCHVHVIEAQALLHGFELASQIVPVLFWVTGSRAATKRAPLAAAVLTATAVLRMCAASLLSVLVCFCFSTSAVSSSFSCSSNLKKISYWISSSDRAHRLSKDSDQDFQL